MTGFTKRSQNVRNALVSLCKITFGPVCVRPARYSDGRVVDATRTRKVRRLGRYFIGSSGSNVLVSDPSGPFGEWMLALGVQPASTGMGAR